MRSEILKAGPKSSSVRCKLYFTSGSSINDSERLNDFETPAEKIMSFFNNWKQKAFDASQYKER